MKYGFIPSFAGRMMMTIASGCFVRPAPDPLAGIDIEREYELIRQKRSTLPRSKRDMVVARWERMYGEGQKQYEVSA